MHCLDSEGMPLGSLSLKRKHIRCLSSNLTQSTVLRQTTIPMYPQDKKAANHLPQPFSDLLGGWRVK